VLRGKDLKKKKNLQRGVGDRAVLKGGRMQLWKREDERAVDGETKYWMNPKD